MPVPAKTGQDGPLLSCTVSRRSDAAHAHAHTHGRYLCPDFIIFPLSSVEAILYGRHVAIRCRVHDAQDLVRPGWECAGFTCVSDERLETSFAESRSNTATFQLGDLWSSFDFAATYSESTTAKSPCSKPHSMYSRS